MKKAKPFEDRHEADGWIRGANCYAGVNKGLSGGVQVYAAQTIPQTDAEIAKRCHFWMETS